MATSARSADDVEPSTRERILQAAARLFRSDANASMEAIATAAAVSRATVHRHFPARDGLVAELRHQALAQLLETLTRATSSDTPMVVRLYSVTAELIAAKLDWSWALSEFETNPGTEVVNPVLEAAVDWMHALAAAGYLDTSHSSRWAATIYLTLIKAATIPLHPEDRIELRTARVMDTFLHGLGATTIRYRDPHPVP